MTRFITRAVMVVFFLGLFAGNADAGIFSRIKERRAERVAQRSGSGGGCSSCPRDCASCVGCGAQSNQSFNFAQGGSALYGVQGGVVVGGGAGTVAGNCPGGRCPVPTQAGGAFFAPSSPAPFTFQAR